MMAALNSTLDQEKMEPEQDDYDAIDQDGYQFRTKVGWEHTAK